MRPFGSSQIGFFWSGWVAEPLVTSSLYLPTWIDGKSRQQVNKCADLSCDLEVRAGPALWATCTLSGAALRWRSRPVGPDWLPRIRSLMSEGHAHFGREQCRFLDGCQRRRRRTPVVMVTAEFCSRCRWRMDGWSRTHAHTHTPTHTCDTFFFAVVVFH